ncbi:EspA/EspE family type VII secretion system effector [Mycolicibacterium boenickei]
MGTWVDVYSSANWANGMYDHTTGMADKDAHVGWGMAGIGADFVGFMQPIAQQVAKHPELGSPKAVAAMATPIIQKALTTMMVMSNTCGFGDPTPGTEFGDGARGFSQLSTSMGSTASPSSWTGWASDGYDKQNRKQQERLARMSESDKAVEGALASEAEQNGVTRKMLDRCQTVCGLSIAPAIAAKLSPPPGPAISIAIEIAAVTATLPLAIDRYLDLIENSVRNATIIRRAGSGYDQIAGDARQQ